MPKLPRLNAMEAEVMLHRNGFSIARSKGSHRVYMKGTVRVVIPFHAGRELHPKIVRQVLTAIEKADENS